MKILVLGGGGFVGRHLCPKLSAAGHDVIQTGYTSTDLPSVDVLDFLSLSQAISIIKPDVVVNLAGRLVRHTPIGTDFIVNSEGPKNLLKVMDNLDYNPFLIHLASSSEPVEKNLPAESEYGITKAIGTDLVRQSLESKTHRGLIVCAHNLYGPNLPKDKLISQIFFSAIEGIELQINFSERVRDFVYIEDFTLIFLRILAAIDDLEIKSVKYLEIGTGIGTSICKLIDLICGILEKKPKIKLLETPDLNPHRVFEANTNFETLCETSLSIGLEKIKGEFI